MKKQASQRSSKRFTSCAVQGARVESSLPLPLHSSLIFSKFHDVFWTLSAFKWEPQWYLGPRTPGDADPKANSEGHSGCIEDYIQEVSCALVTGLRKMGFPGPDHQTSWRCNGEGYLFPRKTCTACQTASQDETE